MRKLALATATAAALALGVGAAAADDPGAAKYFHERGNFDASMALKGPAPDLAGWPAQTDAYRAYGYAETGYGYHGPMGYAPQGGVGIGFGYR